MSDIRQRILQEAYARLNVPYRLDPPPDGVNNLDCSLYVLQVAKAAGLPYPPNVRTAEQIRQASEFIPFSEVLPGDLVFFENTYDAAGPPGPDGKIASHLGISLGRGTFRMLNSLAPVSAETDIGTEYWQTRIFQAGRIPGVIDEQPKPMWVPGIDVSNWQGTVDWHRMKAAGIDFAFIKATESVDFTDPFFIQNWRGAKDAGISRGAYHFARPGRNSAVAELLHFEKALHSAGELILGEDMIVLDLEDTIIGQGPDATGRWAAEWLQLAQEMFGVTPILYTRANLLSSWLPILGRFPLWIAEYKADLYAVPSPPSPWTEIMFWQYSDKGNLGGKNPLDLNWYVGEEPLNEAIRKLWSVAPPAPKPVHEVGSGILSMMAEDRTEPAMSSTFLPLGRSPALVEEALGLNGTVYRWHLPTGKHWRYRASS